MNTLLARWSKYWSWVNNTNPGTWVGHLHQGLVFFWVGYFAVVWTSTMPFVVASAAGVVAGWLLDAGIFAHREGSNFRDAVAKFGARLAFRKKGLDGIMDLTTPVLGSFCNINGLWGGFWYFVGTLIVAHGIIFMAAQVDKREQARHA